MAELVKVGTPIGKLMWLNVSGQGKLNYNEDGREYVASVILDKDTAELLIAQIQEVYDADHQSGKNLKSMGYKPCTEEGKNKDEDGNEVTEKNAEYFVFNFKTGTTFKDGKAKKIAIYNANAKKVDIGDTRVGNGSSGAISGSMRYYINGREDGVSLWLNAVQITKLVEYTEDAGFEVYEDEDSFTGVKDAETGFTGQPEDTDGTNETSEASEEPKKAKPRL